MIFDDNRSYLFFLKYKKKHFNEEIVATLISFEI